MKPRYFIIYIVSIYLTFGILVNNLLASSENTPAAKAAFKSQLLQSPTPGRLNNNGITKTLVATQLGEEGSARYQGTDQISRVTKNNKNVNEKKLVIKPKQFSIKQRIWQEYSYPDSKYAR